MQVFLKHELQHEQVQTVLSTVKDHNSVITVMAKDKEICLNRSLMILCSPYLRSILGSLSSSVIPSAYLIIPSVNSRSLSNLEKILLIGSLDYNLLDRTDIDETVEAGMMLGVQVTNLLNDFDSHFKSLAAQSTDLAIAETASCLEEHVSSPEIAGNCVFVNQFVDGGKAVNHVELNPMVQIKIESEEEYMEQTHVFRKSVFGNVKEEKSYFENVKQYKNTYTELGEGEDEAGTSCSSGQPAILSLEEVPENDDEEGEIRDSSDHGDNNANPQSPTLTNYEETMEDDDVLNIETNPTEIELLLDATKNEIEKFLVVRKPLEILCEPLTIDLAPSPAPRPLNDQSSTSLVSTKQNAAIKAGNKSDSSEARYICNLCSYKTNVGLNIKKHMKTTHKCFYQFKCPKCQFNTSSEDEHKLHFCETTNNEAKPQEPRPDAKFLCSLCSFKTHVPDFIKVHMKNNHKSLYTFKCNMCDFETAQYHKFSNHNCSSDSNPVKTSSVSHDQHGSYSGPSQESVCMRCGRGHTQPCKYPADSACVEPSCGKVGHVKSLHHPIKITDYRAIQEMDDSISLEMPPSRIDKGHSQKKQKGVIYPCKDCSYKTSKASMIKYHAKKTHESHYLFTCNICKFSTTDNNMFPSHRCKEEVTQCPQCDFTTIKSLLMKRHISSQHESQFYACGQCSYKSSTFDSFKKHQLLFCTGNTNEQSRDQDRDNYSCDRCEYDGRDIHSLRKHKTTVHANVPSRRPRSRDHPSPHSRSVTPLRRRETFSPHERIYSRHRTPSSNRSLTPNRGPTTPFPPPAVLYLEPAREEDLFPVRQDRSVAPLRRKSETKAKARHVLLCLRCGRRHAAQCKHPEDSWCSQPDCGRTGHVVTLHHPRTVNDYKLIRSKIPGLDVQEPSEKNSTVKNRRSVARKSNNRPEI